MSSEQSIKCAFCQGTGDNPHFRGTCPVCKGRGKNEVVGKYMACGSCRGSGQKKGTTLTCYDCGGVGVIPDTRETFRKAREEIEEAQGEMAKEREELTKRPMIKATEESDEENGWEEKSFDSAQDRKGEEETGGRTHFCQCCGNEVNNSVTIKICSDCFGKVKELRAYKGT